MLWDNILLIPGIIIGCIDILGMSLAYPLNAGTAKKERERISPEILRLANELMNGQT